MNIFANLRQKCFLPSQNDGKLALKSNRKMKGNHMVDGNKFGSSLVLRAYMDYFYIEIRHKKKTELDAHYQSKKFIYHFNFETTMEQELYFYIKKQGIPITYPQAYCQKIESLRAGLRNQLSTISVVPCWWNKSYLNH